ncbi:MAG: bifunctional oligoribonuclease/PAP phosphatase NrnA [Clostridia bacterium]|nr:bifunctional oligoribonuclease/PAP phosphatase NrnA [Clostridia bacterium]
MSVLENIKESILASNSIVILTHENPDGDAVGSSLAMMLALKKIGKKVDVVIPSLNKMYDILPGYEDIKKYAEENDNYDLCIALDSADLERLHSCKEVFEKAENTIVIDHHITNQNFGDVNYVNAAASSTCQNLVVVIGYLDIAISKDIAMCLYTGILTDTGGFRYNVQIETFEIAAMLLETGIDIAKIYRNFFDLTTMARTKVLGKALDRLELLSNGKVAFTYITKEDEEKYDLMDGDHEGIVNYGRDIENVEVSIFVRQIDEKYKVSMRSNEYLDVSLIASKYGGGGHMKAAGLTSNMSFDLLKQTLVAEIEKQLK